MLAWGSVVSWFGYRLFSACGDKWTLYSYWLPVLSGIPWGLILIPLLFILCTDDLHSLIQSSTLIIYADDVAVYAALSVMTPQIVLTYRMICLIFIIGPLDSNQS